MACAEKTRSRFNAVASSTLAPSSVIPGPR
jgi:hypothetical protein